MRLLTLRSVCRHEINAPTGFERSVPINAVQFYTAQARGSKWLLRHVSVLTKPHFLGAFQVLLGLDALHSNGYVYR